MRRVQATRVEKVRKGASIQDNIQPSASYSFAVRTTWKCQEETVRNSKAQTVYQNSQTSVVGKLRSLGPGGW
jgi:hypothetical protein